MILHCCTLTLDPDTLATILSLTTPTGKLSPEGSLIYLGAMRVLLGIGIGA